MIRRVIPIWEENVRRSMASLELIEEERAREVRELSATLSPDISFSLLGVARIVPNL